MYKINRRIVNVNLWIIQWNGISFVSNGHSWNLMSYIFSGFVADLPGFDTVISQLLDLKDVYNSPVHPQWAKLRRKLPERKVV